MLYVELSKVMKTEELTCPFEVTHYKKGKGIAVGFLQDKFGVLIRIDFGNCIENFYFPDQFAIHHLEANDTGTQNKIKRIINPPHPPRRITLMFGFTYGDKATEIYTDCCALFGWKDMLVGSFGKQKKMFAKRATSEGYSVWMLVHNNLCEGYNENHAWFDYVLDNGVIREFWFDDSDKDLLYDYTKRVCFARTKNGYEFEGIYEYVGKESVVINGKARTIKEYRRISVEYYRGISV